MKNGFEDLRDSLPAIIARTEVGRLTGGLINPRSLANLDAEGSGPVRFKLGRKVAYLREDFIAWLRSRVQE